MATGDDFVLALFAGSTSGAVWLAWWFFVRRKLHRQKSLPRLIGGNAILLLVIGSSFLLSGEIYYRFFYDTTESFGLSRVTQRWFERHFQRNNVNFRDSVDHTNRRLPGMRRWTFLGDSFTAAQGVARVEDRFVERLRERFPNVEIHSQAMCAWDTAQHIQCVQSAIASGYEYDVVVLAYCLNDIADVSDEWQNVLDRVQQLLSDNDFVQHSFFINTMYYRWQSQRDPDIGAYYNFVPQLYSGATWQKQQQRLQELHSAVEQTGAQLVVVTFPFLHALHSDENRNMLTTLDDFWKSENVPHLDLSSAFENCEPADVVVNKFDAHPNERAHEIAAEAIAEFLSTLPGEPTAK